MPRAVLEFWVEVDARLYAGDVDVDGDGTGEAKGKGKDEDEDGSKGRSGKSARRVHLAYAGHFLNQTSAQIEAIEAKLPEWVSPVSWVSIWGGRAF